MRLTDKIFTDAEAAREHLEQIRWPDGAYCPHCGSVEVTSLKGKAHRAGVYQCKGCREQFTVTVKTVFERSKVPLNKWLMAAFLLSSSKKGMSAHQLHRSLGVTYKTAWFMFHRLREAARDDFTGPLGGQGKVVEVDETFVGHITQKGKKGGGTHYMMKVMSLVERGGKARSVVIKDMRFNTIATVLERNLSRESELMTDQAAHYMQVGWNFAFHGSVNHASGVYVSRTNPAIHTQTIENFYSVFKRGMRGIYQHCGEQHLHRYTAEFDFRFNHRTALGWTDTGRTNALLAGIEGKRLTYRRSDNGLCA